MRIASLLSSATEMLFELGLGDQVVAISHECDWPPAALNRPRVTRSYLDSSAPSEAIDAQVRARLAAGEPLYGVDRARLVELRPDVIITQAQCDVCAVRYADVVDVVAQHAALRDAQIVALNPQSLEDVLADIATIAGVCHCVDEGRRVVAALRRRVDRVRARGAGIDPAERPRVAFIEWVEPLMLAGNWTPQMIAWAGGMSLLTTAGAHSPYVAWETFVAARPERIVIGPCGFDLERTCRECSCLFDKPGWSELPAVVAGHVWAVDGNALFNRSGPRLVDSLERLASIILDPLVEQDAFGPLNNDVRRLR